MKRALIAATILALSSQIKLAGEPGTSNCRQFEEGQLLSLKG
jgi:hypothetical protein